MEAKGQRQEIMYFCSLNPEFISKLRFAQFQIRIFEIGN